MNRQKALWLEDYTLRDVLARGLRVNADDGDRVMVMDASHHFAIFEAKDGVVHTPVSGPFHPDDCKGGCGIR